jgi:hypothetical protein
VTRLAAFRKKIKGLSAIVQDSLTPDLALALDPVTMEDVGWRARRGIISLCTSWMGSVP